MHPTDLAAERERRTRKGYQSVARDLRRASVNATPQERTTLREVVIACRLRVLTPEEAHAKVAAIRDQQRERHHQAAA